MNEFLNEKVKQAEIARDLDAVQSVIDGKRELAFLAITTQSLIDPRDAIQALKLAIDNDLGLLPIKGRSEGVALVVYKSDLKAAQELADFASARQGYLNDATPEEAEFIGNALEYHPDEINDYIKRNYKV